MTTTQDEETEKEKSPAQGKTDSVDVRAAEIAKREGRSEITDADREKAFAEMQKTAPPGDAEKSFESK